MKIIDTCGVTNLHGIPGLMGGLAVIPLVKGMNIGNQLLGMVTTIVVALAAGFIVGKILPILGRKEEAYDDAEEFLDVEMEEIKSRVPEFKKEEAVRPN
jgi:ammonium transporter Rh